MCIPYFCNIQEQLHSITPSISSRIHTLQLVQTHRHVLYGGKNNKYYSTCTLHSEGVRERGREGVRERGREGGREGGSEGGREGLIILGRPKLRNFVKLATFGEANNSNTFMNTTKCDNKPSSRD